MSQPEKTLLRCIETVSRGTHLSQDEMVFAMRELISGQASETEIERFLLALRAKGETAAELTGGAIVLREAMQSLPCPFAECIDTCGTGGDGLKTFNISTAAALVTAAAGLPVAKHGNRGISSSSGSADVLRALGVHVEAGLDIVQRCLKELGIGFCFAPLWHPSVRHIGEIRRRLGVPTIFNWLGPLCNPARAPFQLLGVGRPELRQPMAQALAGLGLRRGAVISGHDGLDEITISGTTSVSLIVGRSITHFEWSPEDFGIGRGSIASIQVSGVVESAEIIRRVLAGERGPARDIVTLNAAAALWVAGRASELQDCLSLAEYAIDSAAARTLLKRLAELSHSGV